MSAARCGFVIVPSSSRMRPIRFGVSPAINAIGTLMLLASAVLIIAALIIPRLFNRGTSSLDLITGGQK